MTAQPQPRILVLGHSFVWRLDHYIATTRLPCVRRNFSLPGDPPVVFHGIGGRTMAQLRTHDLHVIATFKPTILILEIGTNDLTNPNTNVTTLAFAIFHLVQFIHHVFHVPYIIISQILQRARPPRGMCPFNARTAHLNRILSRLCKTVPYAVLWFHTRLRRAPYPIFLPDGAHLNQSGNHLLYHSYHKAIHYHLAQKYRPITNHRYFISHRHPWSPPPRHVHHPFT